MQKKIFKSRSFVMTLSLGCPHPISSILPAGLPFYFWPRSKENPSPDPSLGPRGPKSNYSHSMKGYKLDNLKVWVSIRASSTLSRFLRILILELCENHLTTQSSYIENGDTNTASQSDHYED